MGSILVDLSILSMSNLLIRILLEPSKRNMICIPSSVKEFLLHPQGHRLSEWITCQTALERHLPLFHMLSIDLDKQVNDPAYFQSIALD